MVSIHSHLAEERVAPSLAMPGFPVLNCNLNLTLKLRNEYNQD
jgi:hypothetical protein